MTMQFKTHKGDIVHAWQGQAHFLCDIPNHGLTYFKDIDNAVNWLYLNDFKDSARELTDRAVILKHI